MDDLPGDHLPHQRLEGALDPQVDRCAELLFEITPDAEEVTQGFLLGSQFYGNVDIGIFPGLSPGVTAEETDAHHAEALRHLILVGLQEQDDIVFVPDHDVSP